MPLKSVRTRVFAFPYDRDLFDARLVAVYEESAARNTTDIVLDVDIFKIEGEPKPTERDGRPAELVRGEYVPHRLRFANAAWMQLGGLYRDLDALPMDAAARRLYGVLHWRINRLGENYLILTHQMEAEDMVLRAKHCTLTPRPGASEKVEYVRHWAYTPAQAAGIVPERSTITRKYGGDPIAITLDGRRLRERLFIGGIRHQSAQRPGVEDVLNLCEVPNPWMLAGNPHADDRHACKGEMAVGMGLDELIAEGNWVVERLRAGRKVLVHCYAGVNRSATVCCAALMLLEGLTAEQALARVRERHPGCRPDPYHWFLLREIERKQQRERAESEKADGQPKAPDVSDDDTAPLRAALPVG